MTLTELFDDVAEWSPRTFGPDAERGPIGPLKHMAIEILAELLVSQADVQAVFNRAAEKRGELRLAGKTQDPRDRTELADLLILWSDVVRRAGHRPETVLDAAADKMVVNRARTWTKPVGNAVSEHVSDDAALAPLSTAFLSRLEAAPSVAAAAAANAHFKAQVRAGAEARAWRDKFVRVQPAADFADEVLGESVGSQRDFFRGIRVLDDPEADLRAAAHAAPEAGPGPG